jgi:hypothetical protein
VRRTTATSRSDARGCLLAVGWVYVAGLFLIVILLAGGGLSLDSESLSGILLAVGWSLTIPFFVAGHGAPPMSLWARIIVLPLAVGWIVLGWWTMIATCRWWINGRGRRGSA